MSAAADREERLAEVIASIQDELNGGVTPNRRDYLRRFPEFGDELSRYFDCETFLEGALVPGSGSLADVPEDVTRRLDLKAFPIRHRLPDEGLGTVYLLGEERPAARRRELIVLRAWFTPSERERIERSARFFARRRSTGILGILETGRLNQVPFVVREHVRGPSVATLTARLARGAGAVTFEDALHVGRPELADDEPLGDTAPAVAASELASRDEHVESVLRRFADWAEILDRGHRRGLVHREVTPRSLVFTEEGTPCVQGIGLCWSRTGIDPRRMRDWDARWISPEVACETRGPVTWRSDVYGLGVVLASVMGLRAPHTLTDPEQSVESIRQGAVRPAALLPDETPAGLRDLIERATRLAPAERLASLGVMAKELRELAEGRLRRPAAGGFWRRWRR